MLKPTVPKAEKVSKTIAMSSKRSVPLSKKVETEITTIERKVIVKARRTVSAGIRRSNKTVSLELRSVAQIVEKIKIKVVVLTPPPEPPGLAPTNIKKIVNKAVTPKIWFMEIVLKPAVRGVIA